MGRMMRNFIESDQAKELFKQVPPGTVEAIGQSNTPLENLLKGSGVAYPQQQTQTYAPLVQLQQPLPPLQFDNPERAERIESSLGRAAFGPERIREILMQLKEANFLANGGRVGYQVGGVATPEQYAAALQKIGAGTEAQKRTSLGNYLGDYIATQGQKLGNAAVIPYQAAKGVLGIQGTPMTQSMQTSLQDIIQNQIKNTGKLSGDINYKDYGVQTSTGNEFLGFGNRSITDPQAALATTLGRASYTVDPQTGKVNFTGGTAYDFEDDQFGGLGKFISKGGVFGKEATQYNPDISIGKDFMKQFNQPKYPDYKTTALQSQYYKNNPSNLDFDLFRAAYAKASSTPDSQIKTDITDEGQIVTHFGNWDPSRTYAAYMSNTGTSNSNPFFDQFKGSQYSNMPTVMEAMYGAPGNMNPYYANGGSVGVGSMFVSKR
jgi:hypothetical protein